MVTKMVLTLLLPSFGVGIEYVQEGGLDLSWGLR